jgi:hypothetical protein
VGAVLSRPTILCRRSSGEEHELVVALPDLSPPGAAERFAAARGIESFRNLGPNRIVFTLPSGPALTELIREAFSGLIGGYPVVRALVDPAEFPGEKTGCELAAARGVQDPPSPSRPTARTLAPLATAAIAGIAFVLGMVGGGLFVRPDPAASPGEKTVSIPAPPPENVPVDLGTFVAARGPAAAFRAGNGVIRYAVADGSLEGRLRPGTEVRTAEDAGAALFTPVSELRDADGAFRFCRTPAPRNPPDLDAYAAALDSILHSDLVWATAEDSTRSYYALRSAWRSLGKGRVRLEGRPEETGDGSWFSTGPIRARLIDLDDVDLLNLSLCGTGATAVSVYGAIEEETAWDVLRHDGEHPAFSFRVDWIAPDLSERLCREESIEPVRETDNP